MKQYFNVKDSLRDEQSFPLIIPKFCVNLVALSLSLPLSTSPGGRFPYMLIPSACLNVVQNQYYSV